MGFPGWCKGGGWTAFRLTGDGQRGYLLSDDTPVDHAMRVFAGWHGFGDMQETLLRYREQTGRTYVTSEDRPDGFFQA